MAKKSVVLCDTNILIQLFRKNQKVKEQLAAIGPDNIAISVITKAELLAGTNKSNYAHTVEIIDLFALFHLEADASEIFEKLIGNKKIFTSVKELPDLLIAATAIANGIPLYTDNIKHFKNIPGLKLFEII